MELSVLDTTIVEPVTNDQVKTFMGYPSTDTSQDTIIDRMITSAREWLEGRTALSLISKSYKAYFEPEDADEGWYELPVSPVLALPAITVVMNGIDTTFQQRGLKRIRICPDTVFGTIQVGASVTSSYVEVTFQAGASSERANAILLELVSITFNNRNGDDNNLSFARLPYGLQQRITAMSDNL